MVRGLVDVTSLAKRADLRPNPCRLVGTCVASSLGMAKRKRKAGQHDADAFIRESEQHTGSHEDLSEQLGQDYLKAVTSGDDVAEDERDRVVPEELGGPFVESETSAEFGRTLAGLPEDEGEEGAGEASAFPEAIGPLGIAAPDERETRTSTETFDPIGEDEAEETHQPEAEVPSDFEPNAEALDPKGSPRTRN